MLQQEGPYLEYCEVTGAGRDGMTGILHNKHIEVIGRLSTERCDCYCIETQDSQSTGTVTTFEENCARRWIKQSAQAGRQTGRETDRQVDKQTGR